MNNTREMLQVALRPLLAEVMTPLLPLLAGQQAVVLTWQTVGGEQKELRCFLASSTPEGLQTALLHLFTHPALVAPVTAMQVVLVAAAPPAYASFRYRAYVTRPQHPLPERRFTWQAT